MYCNCWYALLEFHSNESASVQDELIFMIYKKLEIFCNHQVVWVKSEWWKTRFSLDFLRITLPDRINNECGFNSQQLMHSLMNENYKIIAHGWKYTQKVSSIRFSANKRYNSKNDWCNRENLMLHSSFHWNQKNLRLKRKNFPSHTISQTSEREFKKKTIFKQLFIAMWMFIFYRFVRVICLVFNVLLSIYFGGFFETRFHGVASLCVCVWVPVSTKTSALTIKSRVWS